ncbi:hypothetical protein JZ751_028619 [Albula glossodonta]|uniref:Cadherin domain-containing protein n=1 Tax=Albula glossodonta TaxID=121402 RepID=A0A8T2NAN2_9TELE|nr:hypothetical protein JZ751_028619 [Albula glossodonta]
MFAWCGPMKGYSIERASDPGKYFYIDITSGALMTVQPLDREELSWHNITVLAMEMTFLVSRSWQVQDLFGCFVVEEIGHSGPVHGCSFTHREAVSYNPSQIGSVSVTVKVLDVNDNPPELSQFYEAFVCESAKAGQVRDSPQLQPLNL